MRLGRGVARFVAAMALTCIASQSDAQERPRAPAPEEEPKALSPYEQDTIRHVLAKRRGEIIDPNPQGKTIERIDIVTLDVLEDRDPLPAFAKNILNVFHVTTREGIVRRELLEDVGQPYDERLIEETARNLRAFPRLSLVLIVPVRGSRRDTVRILVITKDVWSLRLNTDYRISTTGGLEYFLVQPSEENLFGTHQAIVGQFVLDPATYSLGARYRVPRVGGSHIAFDANANAIINRTTGTNEGSFGTVTYGQPLWSTEAEWAWGATISWRKELTRRFDYQHGGIYTYDAIATPNIDDGIPYRWRSDIVTGNEGVIRSFGRSNKHDFTLAMEVSRRVFRTGDAELEPSERMGYPSRFDPGAVAEFEKEVVPVTDTRIGPTVSWHAYSIRFKTVLDFDTLGLQEDYRLGHDLILKLYPVTRALNSSRDYFGIYAAAAYTIALGDGIVRAYVETDTDIEPGCPPEQCSSGDDLPDASIDVGGRIVTPRLGFGRLVFDAHVLNRYRNYLNDRTLLGGDTRLRGYPTQAFIGKDLVSANLEFRSRPLELFTLQLGAVAFFDTGDAFDGFDQMRLKHSVGGGIRVLFPQLDRTVMRIDWGIPVGYAYFGFPGELVWTFRQAFSMPTIPVRQQSL